VAGTGKAFELQAWAGTDKRRNRTMKMISIMCLISRPFGAYPLELKETYPFNAEVTDEPDYES
jgi:hypothetical protein